MEILIILLIVAAVLFLRANKTPRKTRKKRKARIPWIRKRKRKEDTARKGVEGELTVAREIEHWANGKGYLLNDVVLNDPNGDTYQIDHIFINWNGIWVIETKNWSGSIYGKDEDKQWTQVLAGGEVKNAMYNPVKQNLTHVKKLRAIIGKDPIIIPLVVVINADISNVQSMYTCAVEKLPNILGKNFGEVLIPQDMKEYYKTILFYQSKCGVTSAQHAQIQEERKQLIDQGFCPSCGGILVKREGMYGSFYGCSRFPECKFKMKIDE